MRPTLQEWHKLWEREGLLGDVVVLVGSWEWNLRWGAISEHLVERRGTLPRGRTNETRPRDKVSVFFLFFSPIWPRVALIIMKINEAHSWNRTPCQSKTTHSICGVNSPQSYYRLYAVFYSSKTNWHISDLSNLPVIVSGRPLGVSIIPSSAALTAQHLVVTPLVVFITVFTRSVTVRPRHKQEGEFKMAQREHFTY